MADAFTRFRDLILVHPDVLSRLLEAETPEALLDASSSFAHDHGCAVSLEELETAMRVARREHVERWLR